MATPAAPVVKKSFLDKLENTVYLPFALKAFGIILFAVSFFYAWHHVSIFQKAGFIAGPIAFFVGLRFNKIYR